ncbi:TonB-dependent receptor family protein [Halioxenophilus sp. WMMB6]|uniref:TonB-dependent receptor family protein n=1 Tax=Halioxenophilus sp. WMMB6 TaxID=3073815 RepID=UPI00295EE9C7|nr:TonB-dependent receptor [Halioxenophilus sp. WMMB6]
MKSSISTVCATAVLGVAAGQVPFVLAESDRKAANTSMEQVVIIGSKQDADSMAGSAYVVDAAELSKFEYTDINRILSQVPGVYIQEEEGYGLRPNIRIRSAQGERSSKVNLMEDGVLIAPAPYSGPEAYYFPTAGRMSTVEVLKGPETIKYGPQTVGGAVNLISTPIPESAAGAINIEAAEDGESRIHAWYGDSQQNYGWLLETHQHNGDGFKSIDRSSRDTGFNKEDYLAKLRVNSTAGEGYYNQVDLKLQYSTEISNQSYLGLTDSDFDRDPNRRYGISDRDQMDNEHAAVTVSHLIEFSDSLSLKTTAYYNEFERNWYKLDNGGGYINAANLDPNGADAALLSGARDSFTGEYLNIKNNAREYESYGVQTVLGWSATLAGISHDFELGARWHEDEVDRFQPVDRFAQVNGSLVYVDTVDPSASNNRIETADALSLYLFDNIALSERLNLVAGLRYEEMDTDQTRYNLDRSVATRTAENSTEVSLLSLGATYQLNDAWQLLAGVHEGFAPAGADATATDPEESLNYEMGTRFTKGGLAAELIYFFSAFDNSVTYCSVANPCAGGVTAGSISQGKAEIDGLEFLIRYDFAANASYQIPVSFSYTYTDTEYTEGGIGDAQKGDIYAYVPESQWAAAIGFVATNGWDIYLNASFTDEMCLDTSCERSGTDTRFLQTDDLLIFDLSASYPMSETSRVYVKVDNLLDDQEIISRSPAGARANKPRTAYLGLEVNF